MAERPGFQRRIATTLSWPVGVSWTAWHYLWRTLPVGRTEYEGTAELDLPPALPPGTPAEGIKTPAQGVGPLLHRIYRCRVLGAERSHREVMARLQSDPDRIAPRRLARLNKITGEPERMTVGDEFVVRMPGPWDGPVRVVSVGPEHFRCATMRHHLEAGQIEWRAWSEPGALGFAIESWARSGDRLSAVLHDNLPMAKEVQFYMWTSVLQRVPELAGGRLDGRLSVTTRYVPPEALPAAGDPRQPGSAGCRRGSRAGAARSAAARCRRR